MIAGTAIASANDRLPPLGGGLLWLYRMAFAALAIGALAAVAWPWFGGMADPVVAILRSVKGLALIAASTILFRRRQSDPVAALLSLAFLVWTISSSVDFTSTNLLPQLLDRGRFLLLALALLLFPNGDWQPHWTRHAALASIAVFVLGIIETVDLLPTALFLPLAIGCILAAIAALIASFQGADDEVIRKQLKWVSLGLVGGVGLILSARAGAALNPSAGMVPILWEAMFQCGIVIIAVGFLVSLLRYRLFDAEAVISRSAVYAILTAALVATFAGSEAVIEMVGQQYLGAGIGQVSGAMAAAIAAVLLSPLHTRISSWAELHFQADLVQLKSQFPDFLSDLPLAWSPEEVASAALPHIARAVHADSAWVTLGPTVVARLGPKLEQAEPGLRLPLRCPYGGERGMLCIGPRPDGSGYGNDERAALAEIVVPFRRRLLAAEERSAEKRREAEFRSSMAIEIRQLAARIAALPAGGTRNIEN